MTQVVRVSPDVRVAKGTRLERSPALPPIDGARELRHGPFDVVGGIVRKIGGRGPLPESPAVRQAAAGAVTPVRIMSFNIRGGMGPGKPDATSAQLDALAAAIRTGRPDIVLLQEVDDYSSRSNHFDDLNELARRLRPDSAVAAAPIRRISGASQEVAVLTFNGFRIADARNVRLPHTAGDSLALRAASGLTRVLRGANLPTPIPEKWQHYNPRNALDTLVATPTGQQVRVINLHLSGGMHGAKPTDELDPLAGTLDALTGALQTWQGPLVVGGDFNILSATKHGSKEAATFARAGLVDAFTAVGITAGDPVRRTFLNPASNGDIDRIYASSGFKPTAVGVDTAVRVSDHAPLIVDYELAPAPTELRPG